MEAARASLVALDDEKRRLEREIEEQLSILQQAGAPDLQTPLVDAEGFPRADLDLYLVRGARHKIACLRTDYKEITTKLEKALHAFHAEFGAKLQKKVAEEEGAEVGGSGVMITGTPPRPFAVIDDVFEGSPAAEAGLKIGDLVVRVGSLSLKDRRGSGVTEIFGNLGRELKPHTKIEVAIVRDGIPHVLTLEPKQWGGQGLLGCHLQPNKNCASV